MTTPCIRCGKLRIVSREWKETIQTRAGSSVIFHTVTICPDPDCQMAVDKMHALQKEKMDKIKKDFLDRAALRAEKTKAARIEKKESKEKAERAAKQKTV